ncbi:MAG: tetratricopeptide repeat protein [Gammaproteobacteria bacterium]|nr:tetratricopeptide repeat protein [Gammaproteobacteria bacterium]
MDQLPTTPATDPRRRFRRTVAAAQRVALLAGSLAFCAGCVSNSAATYDDLAAEIRAGKDPDMAVLRTAFVAAPDYLARLETISALETQVVGLIGEEPLRLGPLGSAIVDRNPGSLAGHQALAAFYSYLDREDTAARHRGWVSEIRAVIDGAGSGTSESPLPVISPAEPSAYLFATGRTPVGSMYVPTDATPFLLRVDATRGEGRPIENVYFDLETVYNDWLRSAQDEEDDLHAFRVLYSLAERGDAAAQTLLGSLSLREDRLEHAARLLTRASTGGNLIAHLMLARLYWSKAMDAQVGPDREGAQRATARNYEYGIGLGSDEAMYELGRLYVSGHYGEERHEQGLDLLVQASGLENADACFFLANWFEFDWPDYDRSEKYYLLGANLDDPGAKIGYARFLMRKDVGKQFTDQAYRWLTELARNNRRCEDLGVFCAEARIQLGNLFAKGIHVRRNFRKARSWLKSAVSASPDHAGVVKDVAWTLTVSNLERLRDAPYALQIMDQVMSSNERARGMPAYIDTWAAAYAANGDFERAIELQREALDHALNGDSAQQIDDETIEILREHLQAFEAGRTITDVIP